MDEIKERVTVLEICYKNVSEDIKENRFIVTGKQIGRAHV